MRYRWVLLLVVFVFVVVGFVYAQIFEDPLGRPANDVSGNASLTGDSTKAVFHSWATNLATAPRCANVFLKDIRTGAVTLIKDHALSPAFSSDGLYIAYEYSPDPDHGTLPQIMLYNTVLRTEKFVDYSSLGNTKGGWYMPDILITNGNVLYHSTKSGKLAEYIYSISSGTSQVIK